ncbi:thioesterase [Fervidicella metallireducens AeB]|uniref:Thioesterase n=2 Tax=Fervidicella TaxID=1403538 RepID=A0A017RU13_9CLOT|nr:thioesterase family protein [Fervidicella metallireducens]EYE87929.1 thioesterase [Fervidicella metallireducens AeB]
MENVKVGLKAKIETVAEPKDSAVNYGSGGVDVYSTPAMVGLMESAAKKAVDTFLPDGYTTVGIKLDIKHLAATPIGMKVKAEAELIEVDGRKLTFKVEAYDEAEKIGEGLHERFVIDSEKFLSKLNNKTIK